MASFRVPSHSRPSSLVMSLEVARKVMQEGVDADGGYTVPVDIVAKIISLRESKESLLKATAGRRRW